MLYQDSRVAPDLGTGTPSRALTERVPGITVAHRSWRLPRFAAGQPAAAFGTLGARPARLGMCSSGCFSCSECQFSLCATCQAEALADDPCACTRTASNFKLHSHAVAAPQMQAAAELPSAPAWNGSVSSLPDNVLFALREAVPARSGAGGVDTVGGEDPARLMQESLLAEACISGVDCHVSGGPVSLASALAAGTVALGCAEVDTASDALLAAALAEAGADHDGTDGLLRTEKLAARAAQEAAGAEAAARLAAEDEEQRRPLRRTLPMPRRLHRSQQLRRLPALRGRGKKLRRTQLLGLMLRPAAEPSRLSVAPPAASALRGWLAATTWNIARACGTGAGSAQRGHRFLLAL